MSVKLFDGCHNDALGTICKGFKKKKKKKKDKDKIILINKQTSRIKSIFVQLGSYWKSLHCWNVFRNFKQIKLMMMMTEKDCGQNDRVSRRLHIKKLHESEVIKRLE